MLILSKDINIKFFSDYNIAIMQINALDTYLLLLKFDVYIILSKNMSLFMHFKQFASRVLEN